MSVHEKFSTYFSLFFPEFIWMYRFIIVVVFGLQFLQIIFSGPFGSLSSLLVILKIEFRLSLC